MKIIGTCLFWLLIIPAFTHYSIAQTAQSDIPADYQSMYTELENKLHDIDSYVNSNWDGSKKPITFCTDLLVANSNRGEELLIPQTFQSAVFTLDRLQSLGLKGISLAISYPILVPTFSRNAEYLNFYKRLALEIKKRNMKMQISVHTIFPNPAFSSLHVDYSGLTIDKYKQEKKAMVQLIINELLPDYVTVENEPDTQQMNTGLPFTVQNFTSIVQYILNGLDKRGALIGAGTGTWSPITYIQSLAQYTSIDFIDIHVYLIHRDFVIDKVIQIAGIAKTAKMQLILGEGWLNKMSESELGSTSGVEEKIFARDGFAFWIPLDQQFITTMVKLCYHLKIEWASFFWMKYFYGYYDYADSVKNKSAVELIHVSDSVAARNIYLNILSPTGVTLKNLIATQTDVKSLSNEPPDFYLGQNYPNPFSQSTIITLPLLLPKASIRIGEGRGEVSFKVYDVLGREVLDLSNQIIQNSSIIIRNVDMPMPGMYFYQWRNDHEVLTKKMIFIK